MTPVFRFIQNNNILSIPWMIPIFYVFLCHYYRNNTFFQLSLLYSGDEYCVVLSHWGPKIGFLPVCSTVLQSLDQKCRMFCTTLKRYCKCSPRIVFSCTTLTNHHIAKKDDCRNAEFTSFLLNIIFRLHTLTRPPTTARSFGLGRMI